MAAIFFAVEYFWIHFAVYARAFTASVREVHEGIGFYD